MADPKKSSKHESESASPIVSAKEGVDPLAGAAVVVAGADKAPAAVAVEPTKPPAPTGRKLTVVHWARGRRDALMKAFLVVQAQHRVEKKTAAEWMALYRSWLSQPRG